MSVRQKYHRVPASARLPCALHHHHTVAAQAAGAADASSNEALNDLTNTRCEVHQYTLNNDGLLTNKLTRPS